MTDPEITIACAELDGWTHIHSVGKTFFGNSPEEKTTRILAVPHYLHDANAAIALCKKWVRDNKHRRRFEMRYDDTGWCVRLIARFDDTPDITVFSVTACRAATEAYLRANGKWREA